MSSAKAKICANSASKSLTLAIAPRQEYLNCDAPLNKYEPLNMIEKGRTTPMHVVVLQRDYPSGRRQTELPCIRIFIPQSSSRDRIQIRNDLRAAKIAQAPLEYHTERAPLRCCSFKHTRDSLSPHQVLRSPTDFKFEKLSFSSLSCQTHFTFCYRIQSTKWRTYPLVVPVASLETQRGMSTKQYRNLFY
jgi:hypothetical protein